MLIHHPKEKGFQSTIPGDYSFNGRFDFQDIYEYVFLYPGSSKTKLCHLVVENPLNMDHPKDQPLCLVLNFQEFV